METNYKEKINKILKDLMITKSDFCEQVELNRTYIYGLETGTKRVNKELLKNLEEKLRINKEWFLGNSEVMKLPNTPIAIDLRNNETPMLWEDLKQQYEKRIQELEFLANMYKAEKMADPRYSNFLKPNTKKGQVIPFSGAIQGTGAACGVVANFS